MNPLPYSPEMIIKPVRCLEFSSGYGTSSWEGIEFILADLLAQFNVGKGTAIEFGVEHGFSAVALSNFFATVIGVDPFGQQTATEPIEPMEDRCRRNCEPYKNIILVTQPWQEFTKSAPADSHYDLVHVDAEHGYYDTFGIGDWACAHSPFVIFHDTSSFPQTVMPAVKDLAEKHKRVFYNYDQFHGLGILVNP